MPDFLSDPEPTALTRALSERVPLSLRGHERAAWIRRTHDTLTAQYRPLEQRLLAIGGHVALFVQVDPDYAALLERGRLWDHHLRVFCPGRTGRCHQNSARLYLEQPGRYSIVTGYALTVDGDGLQVWRQHTWLRDAASGALVETTVAFDAYWGTELTGQAADFFAHIHQ